MTVFKTYLKILRKNMFMVIVFTFMLVLFGGLRSTSDDKSLSFSSVKPDILIVNNDKEEGITKHFIEYIKENSETPEINYDEESINDALFYNDTDYVIYIPQGFNENFMNGSINSLDVKKGINFNSSYSEMIVERYFKIANYYKDKVSNEEELINIINDTLINETEINILTKLDTDKLEEARFFFDFESYSLIVCLVFIIGLILSIFNSEKIRKRNVISSTSYKKNNRLLLLSNLLYAFTIWVIYLLLALIILGDILWTSNGIMLIINSFIYLLTLTSLAFLLGNLITNKDSVNGITNIIGIGTSFLCGVFVPLDYLPETVKLIAHFLPTYYYVESNKIITSLEEVNLTTLGPVFINMGILIICLIIFIILSNIVSNKRRKIA